MNIKNRVPPCKKDTAFIFKDLQRRRSPQKARSQIIFSAIIFSAALFSWNLSAALGSGAGFWRSLARRC